MDSAPLTNWGEVGARVGEARLAAGLTQQELAARIGVSRTGVVRIEAGTRGLDALELARLATATGRSVEWFVSRSAGLIASHRTGRAESAEADRLEDELERAAHDVSLLIEINELRGDGLPEAWGMAFGSLEEAEQAAIHARDLLGNPDDALHELAAQVESLGMLVFSVDLRSELVDGAYIRVGDMGVAVINGRREPGRRRFNVAHELGHHMLGDEYTAEFGLGTSAADRERLIDAFAVHLLLPRSGVTRFWDARREAGHDARSILIQLAAAYRVSWSAACGQAKNLGLIDHSEFESVRHRRPTPVDYIELGIPKTPEELNAPHLPSRFSQAALRAFRRHKIGERRLRELLRGVIDADALPPTDDVGLHALRSDFHPLP